MRRRREIFIELTSLLDVILIMLFVLLTQAKSQTAAALSDAAADRERAVALEREVDTLRQELGAMQEEADGWKRQILSEDLVLDHSLVVTISVNAGGDIRLESEGTASAVIAYDWEDDTYAGNRLRSALSDQLRRAGTDAVFLVFQYDRGTIYRAEYDMIRQRLQEAKLEARERALALSILELDTNTNTNQEGAP